MQTGFKINLPTSVSREEAEQSRTVVCVGPQGQVVLGSRTMTKEALRAALRRLPARTRDQGLVVMADRLASYAKLVEVMDVAIGLATAQGR